FRADQFGVEVLAAGDVLHFGRDRARAGGFELGHGVVVSRTRGWPGGEGRVNRRTGSDSLSFAGMTRIRFEGCDLSRRDGRGGTPSDVVAIVRGCGAGTSQLSRPSARRRRIKGGSPQCPKDGRDVSLPPSAI